MVNFFFQAEDGIRDIGVTGVQTCALPILGLLNAALLAPVWLQLVHLLLADLLWLALVLLSAASLSRESETAEETRRMRSGERRVGKECRSRWAPHHVKKLARAIRSILRHK